MVSLSIDGKKVEVEPGTTILKAAEKIGIKIPTFCWHAKLLPTGSCRICLVEVEKLSKLQVACATAVAQDMVVWTNTPKVQKARKGVLEFLLINHPLDCPTCDKGGECDLQDIVFQYGTDKSRFKEEKRRHIVDPKQKFDDLKIGPQIIRNQNRCILCGRCVRFIFQIAGEADLGGFKRGWKTEINTLPEIPIRNQFAGNVTEICPVGALTTKAFRYKIRVWLTKPVKSVCPFCADGCNLSLWHKYNKVWRATSRKNDYVDEGFICDRGRFGYDFVNHPERLDSPLIKKNGKFEKVGWKEVLELVSFRLNSLKEKLGAESIAGVGSAKCTNEDNYLFQKFFREVIGTNNIDHRVGFKNLLPSPSLSSYENFYFMKNSIEEIEKAKAILVFGCDIDVEHPIIGLRIKKAILKNNAALVLANPYKIKLNRFATKELVYNSGSELFLINAWLRNSDWQNAEKATGIKEEEIRKALEILKSAESLVILTGREVLHHYQNKEIISSLKNLLKFFGKYGKANCGFNLLYENNNSQGALDMGLLPDRLPGYAHSNKVGMNFNQMLENAHSGKLKAIYFMGSNPVYNYPDREYIESALKKLDFVVVQDVFLTETAKLADVVLPGCFFAEKEGSFTNCERRMQKINPTYPPLAGSKPDWKIIAELANYSGFDFGFDSVEKIAKEIKELNPIYREINYSNLPEEGIRWNLDNKKEFEFPIFEPEAIQEDEQFPFVLKTGNTIHHWGTSSLKSENLNVYENEPYACISPLDAQKLNIKENDWVTIESVSGKIKIQARIGELIPEKVFYIPLLGAEINKLMKKENKIDRVRIGKFV